ncbi:MAG: membrane lipoprotein lipid attachment site-containing protein [Pseudomonadota bacterium]
MKKIIIVAVLGAALAGCSNLKFQFAASYKTDNLIGDLRELHQPAPPAPEREAEPIAVAK